MSLVFERPSLLRRLSPWFSGFDGPLAFAVFMLVCAGLLTMYSSGYDHGTRFEDHARNMLIAGFIMFVVAQIPPQRLMALAVPLYILGVGLLIAVAVFGVTKKGARRWLNVGVTIQPSEILKIAMPLMLAWWFQKREGQLRPLDFLVAGVLLALPVGLIMKQPDLGTSLLVLAAGLSVIFFAGLSWKLVAPPLIAGVAGHHACWWCLSPSCVPTVCAGRCCTTTSSSGCARCWTRRAIPLGKGFHIIQGMIAIGSGGFWGKGFMQGTQTHLEFIPERTTDFIFAAFSEEFGLIGNLLLIAGFVFLVLRAPGDCAGGAYRVLPVCWRVAMTMIFFCYAFVNMGMVSGILPVVGVPLPFISYGGTAMVTLGLGLGILMSIAKSKRLVQS